MDIHPTMQPLLAALALGRSLSRLSLLLLLVLFEF